jgi:hypothetical protein
MSESRRSRKHPNVGRSRDLVGPYAPGVVLHLVLVGRPAAGVLVEVAPTLPCGCMLGGASHGLETRQQAAWVAPIPRSGTHLSFGDPFLMTG